jgi:hypothetical protein
VNIQELKKFIKVHFAGSQKDFSVAVGVTPAGVCKWKERGAVPAYIASWCRLYESRGCNTGLADNYVLAVEALKAIRNKGQAYSFEVRTADQCLVKMGVYNDD